LGREPKGFGRPRKFPRLLGTVVPCALFIRARWGEGVMTDVDHDPALRQEFANLPNESGERKLRFCVSQVFPAIFAAAAFIAIGLFLTHFTDVVVGPWMMWLTLFALWAYCTYRYLREDVIGG
jgi:hypothetical protein